MAKEIVISRDVLRKLYLHKGLSSSQIAKIYNCTPCCIRYKLRKFKIPIRSVSEAMMVDRGINISQEELRKLYLKKKLSTYKIAKLYRCNEETIRERLHKFGIPIRPRSEANRIYPVYDFAGTLEEKSYLIGFRLGDLYVGKLKKNGQTIEARCSSTRWEQINLIKRLFSPYGHVRINQRDKRGAIKIRCHLNMTFDFLLNKKDKISQWIYRDDERFMAFLAGYFDAEGYMGVRKDDTSEWQISSYDKNILHQIYQKLNTLNIKCLKPWISREKGYIDDSFGYRNDDRWTIGVFRKNSLLRLLKFMRSYLKHPKNIKAMKIVIDNINERNKKFGNLRMD
jgi:intein-encoded DNA endonuclease-like protein